MRVRLLVLLAFPALAASAAAMTTTPPITPPPGMQVVHYQAEDRVRDSGMCAPDDEWMEVRNRSLAQEVPEGGELLWYPHTDCWAEWEVNFEEPMEVWIKGEIGRPIDPQCGHWKLFIDGSLEGQTQEDCDEDGLQLQEPGGNVVPRGFHVLRVASRWLPVWSNGAVDYLELRSVPPPPQSCIEGLTATALPDESIELAWPSINNTGYQLAVREGNGPWTPVQPQLPPGATSFTYVQAVSGRVYTFGLAALQGEGAPPRHHCEASATAIPDLPGGLALGLAGGLALAGYGLWAKRRP